MRKKHRSIIRIANLIRDQVIAQEQQKLAAINGDHRHISGNMQQYLVLWQKLAKAEARHWHTAAVQIFQQAENTLDDLRYALDARRGRNHGETKAPASPADILRDLEQLETEFREWRFDAKTQELSVRTDCIELEGIDLGPFQITLHLSHLSHHDPSTAYSIRALDPNPASTRSDVTHPHVSDERLCSGDATAPIRTALATGRICDFFLLVRSVLQTYNSHSPYVPLSAWSGAPCHDCGYVMGEDERYVCDLCNEDFCESCSSYCRHCENSGCLSCLESCPHCDERFCPQCLEACSECQGRCCVDCLTDGLCPACYKAKENNHEQQSSEPAAVQQNAA